MKRNDKYLKDLLVTARDAYRNSPGPQPSDAWVDAVMCSIRNESSKHVVPFRFQEKIVWRVAAVAALAGVLVGAISYMTRIPEAETRWELAMSGAQQEWLIVMEE